MATECPAPDGSSPRQTKFSGEMPMCIDPAKQYQATIVTNHGTMTAFLHPGNAPRTVNNFVCLARYHYFDGLTFHRIIKDFVIQGGCPEGTGATPATASPTSSPRRASTRWARWPWPTPGPTPTAASSS